MRNCEKVGSSHRRNSLLLLFVILVVTGCTPPVKTPSLSEVLQKHPPAFKPTTKRELIDAERLIIISSISQPMGEALEKPTPAAAVVGNIFMGGLIGYFLTQPKDISSQYQSAIAERMPDFPKYLRTKLEEGVNSQRHQPTINEAGPLAYRKDLILKPSDSVLEVRCLPNFSTDNQGKHLLEINLFWYLVTNGIKCRELSDKMEAARHKNIFSSASEMKKIMAQYDGQGYFFYKSAPHTKEEWLRNDGKLLQQKMKRGIESVVNQLTQAILPEKGA